ncbi:MAG: RluA family pseudouridine synthase [Lachnospirales bacterium]
MREIIVNENNANQRVDKFILKYLNKAPKSFVYKMIRKKNFKLNDVKIDGSEILNAGDNLKLFLSDETIENFREEIVPKKTNGTLDIVFEDENIIVANKPQGVLSQPRKEEDKDTMVDRLLSYLYEKEELNFEDSQGFKPGVSNRLDINTSGLVVCGKNLRATQRLNELIKEHKVDKFYLAVVKGVLTEDKTLKGYHYKDFKTNEATVSSRRRSSKDTEVETMLHPLKNNGEYTLLSLKLITGKSHQIRASLKLLRTFVVGDRKYGDEDINLYFKKKYGISNQLLVANKLIINDEDGFLSYLNNREFEAPLYKQFKAIINDLF